MFQQIRKGLKCTIDGVEYTTLAEAAKAWGVVPSTIRNCLDKNYWRPLSADDLQKSIACGKRLKAAHKKFSEPWTDHTGQKFPNFHAMAEYWGYRDDFIKARIYKQGWSLEQALTTPARSGKYRI